MANIVIDLDAGDRIPEDILKFSIIHNGERYAVFPRRGTTFYLNKTYRGKKFEINIGQVGELSEDRIIQGIAEMRIKLDEYDVGISRGRGNKNIGELAKAREVIQKLSEKLIEKDIEIKRLHEQMKNIEK